MPDVWHVPAPPGPHAFLSGPGQVECAWRRRLWASLGMGRVTAERPRAGIRLSSRPSSACRSSDDILERALTHRSYAYENGGLPTNERLEFLGDSVLGWS